MKQNTIILCESVYSEIHSYFNFIRQDELKLAFSNGVRGLYGEYFGLNVVTFHKWLKAFQIEDKRKTAINDMKKDFTHEPIINKDEAEYEWKQTIKKQFQNFKENGIFVCEFPNFQYEEFEKRGLINYSLSEKKEIYSQAESRVIQLKKQRRLNPKSRIEYQNINSFLKRFEEKTLNSTDQQEIKAEARRIAIKKYYESIAILNL